MGLYLKFVTMHLKSQMQHKTSFFLIVFGQFAVSFTAFLSVWFMFEKFPEVQGFSFSEVLLCFATILMSSSLAECFGRGFDLFPSIIANGEFDRILVRPRHEIFLVLGARQEFSRVGRLLQAIFAFIYALPTSGVAWSWDKVLTLFLMLICGSVVFFSLYLIYVAFTFFTLEGLEFMNILTDGGRDFGRYPFSIYGSKVLKFLTYIVPLALVQYYPFLYLLDRKTDSLHMLAPLGGLLFILPAYLFWKFGLRNYISTGS